ncbi:MAG: hypothetical protein ACE5JI_13325 [Acidobacteriota bacterium]
MADRISKVSYCYTVVPNRAGQGSKILGQLKEAGVNLLAFSGFPAKRGKAQLDLVCDDMAAVRRVAKKNGWRLSATKKGFLVHGTDEIGSVHRHLDKLANEKINVIAVDAVSAGKGRYGMILWVRPKQYARAARILRAR